MASWKALLAACLLLTTDEEHKDRIERLATTVVEAVFNAYDVQCFPVLTQEYDEVSLLLLKYLSQHTRFSFVMEFGGRRGDCPGYMIIGRNPQAIFEIWNTYFQLLISSKSLFGNKTRKLSKKYVPFLMVINSDTGLHHRRSFHLRLGGDWFCACVEFRLRRFRQVAHDEADVEKWALHPSFTRRSALGVASLRRTVLVAGPAPFRAFWADRAAGRFVPLDRRLAETLAPQNNVRVRWPDIRGEELRMAVTHLPPFMSDNGGGVEIKIVETLADVLNGKLTFQPTINDEPFWELSLNWTRNSVTNVTGGFALNLLVSLSLDFGVPWSSGCTTLLAPRPQPSYGDAAALLRPLAPAVWLALLLALLATGLALLAVARLQPGARRHPLHIAQQPGKGVAFIY
ncbi:Protein of unknown function [Gryllus bimaculatus]|nr:Protein of unknown function [Gryllus bimaculatus]